MSAGRTAARPTPAAAPSEHPRVGGENQGARNQRDHRTGTPPRRRGGLHAGVDGAGGGRNTPASAGRTCVAAHHTVDRLRNIPASAGRTRITTRGPGRPTEHSRVGGGGPPQLAGLDDAARNTPASAGRTPAPTSRPTPAAEHPRVGGEDWIRYTSTSSRCGTPPRRRGGPVRVGRDRPDGRNTPRVGGEDRDGVGAGVEGGGTPPRRRGGHVERDFVDLALRNTPASAGRTTTEGESGRVISEHPRVGGEDTTPSTRRP